MTLRTQKTIAACAGLVLAAGLAACGGGGTTIADGPLAPAPTSSASTASFPITVNTGQFGDVTIPKEPQRVVAIGMADADILVALGITPVMMLQPTWIPNGVNPWLSEALNGAKPAGYTGADGYPMEQIAQTTPDLIVGVNEYGITDYMDKLKAIAPTVAFDETKTQLSWEEHTRLIAKAVGREAQAQALIDKAYASMDRAKADNPQIVGKKIVFAIRASNGTLGVNTGDVPGNQIFRRLGLVVPSELDAAVGENGLSFERLDLLKDLDVMIVQPTDQKEYDAFASRDLAKTLRVVKNNGVIVLIDPVDAGSATTGLRKPSVLAIPWLIDHLMPRITQAIANTTGGATPEPSASVSASASGSGSSSGSGSGSSSTESSSPSPSATASP